VQKKWHSTLQTVLLHGFEIRAFTAAIMTDARV